MPLSKTAETGFAAAATYDSHRPSYQAEAVDQFLNVLNIKDVKGARVVDLAAGTGKFTEILASRPEGFDITAIEPHSGMRKELENKTLRGVRVYEGSAEDMAVVEPSSVDAVVAAQAFHWFSNMNALKEIARVLKPTGVFGMIWNIEDFNAPLGWDIHDGWETIMREQWEKLDDGLPRFRNEQWKKVFDEQTESNPFTLHFADPLFGLPIGEASIDTKAWLSKQALWDRFKTYSQIANLSVERLKEVEETYWAAVSDSKTEMDAEGRVAVHGKVVWAWTSKIPDAPLQNFGRPDE